MRYVPHAYQERASRFVEDRPACALFLDMGLGKTVAALTAVDRLVHDWLEVDRVLVIAPKSVALNTWAAEASKWDHLRRLRVSVAVGSAAQRRRALAEPSDVCVINRENTAWLVAECRASGWPFDMVVLDESSSFKDPSTRRFKALRSVRPRIRRIVELTGTPSPNGLMDLWAQLWLLDMGRRLGRTLGDYRRRYFREGRRNGAVVYDWIPVAGAAEAVTEAIGDVCLSMRASDWLEMPPVVDAGLSVDLGGRQHAAYRKFEREQLMSVDGEEIEAATAAALANKLLQYTGGAVYDADHGWHEVGTAKLEALEEIVEAAGSPVLVYCQYRSERERITAAMPSATVFRGEPDVLARWNRGAIPVLLAHPASVAYGLNMQDGGHVIVWYSPTWNLELYQQANARLHRQGQRHPVMLYHLVAPGTIDEAVMASLRGKGGAQDALLRRVRMINCLND